MLSEPPKIKKIALGSSILNFKIWANDGHLDPCLDHDLPIWAQILVSFVPPQVSLSDLCNSQPSSFQTGQSSYLHSLLPYILIPRQLLHALQPVSRESWPENVWHKCKTILLTLNKQKTRYFSSKMSLFGSNDETILDVRSNDEPRANPKKQRKGKSVKEENRMLEEPF